MILGHLQEDVEVAEGSLLVAEVEAEDLSGGVIDGPMQVQDRSSILQPRERAGVDLDHHAFLGHACAGSASPGRFVRMAERNPGFLEDTTDRLGAQGDGIVLLLSEELGHVLATGATVRAENAVDHLLADLMRDGMAGLAPPVLVNQEGWSLEQEPFLEPLDVT